MRPTREAPTTCWAWSRRTKRANCGDPERKNYFLLAARYLALARERGFNQATGPTGTVLLGESLYFAGRVKASRPVLEQAIELAPDEATMIHRLLADAYRRKPKPNLEQALAHNRKYLEDADLPLTDRHAGQLQQANLLWQTEGLCRLPEGDRRDSGRRLRACRSRSAARAAGDARGAQSADDSLAPRRPKPSASRFSSNIRKRSRSCARRKTIRWGKWRFANRCISSALCLMEMGDSTAALAQFQRTRSVYLDTPEGLAAGLEEADLLRALHRDEDALAEYRQVLGGIREKPAFTNRWISAKKFRARILKAYQYYLDGQHYDEAVRLAERMSPLFPRSQSVQLVAETYRTWARTEVRLSETLPEPQVERNPPPRTRAVSHRRPASSSNWR